MPRCNGIELLLQLRRGNRRSAAAAADAVQLVQAVIILLPVRVDAPHFSDRLTARKFHGHADDRGDDKHIGPEGAVCRPHARQCFLHAVDFRAGVQHQISHFHQAVQQKTLPCFVEFHTFFPLRPAIRESFLHISPTAAPIIQEKFFHDNFFKTFCSFVIFCDIKEKNHPP